VGAAVSNPTSETVRDQFGSSSYGNSDGSVFGGPDWRESDGGGGGAPGGAIRITGGELRIRDGVSGYPSIRRTVDLYYQPY